MNRGFSKSILAVILTISMTMWMCFSVVSTFAEDVSQGDESSDTSQSQQQDQDNTGDTDEP